MPDALSGFFDNGGRRAYVCRIVGAKRPPRPAPSVGSKIDAIGPGTWGDRVFVKLVGSTKTTGPNKDPVGFRLQVAYWQTPTSDGQYPDPFDRTQPRRLAAADDGRGFRQPRLRRSHLAGLFSRSGSRTTRRSSRFRPPSPVRSPRCPTGTFAPLAGGADGTAPTGRSTSRVTTRTATCATGLAALEISTSIREVALVTAPAAPNESSKPCARIASATGSASPSSTAPRKLADANDDRPANRFDTSYCAASTTPGSTPPIRRAARRARAAGRSRARHLRPHRHRARRVQGAGQRGAARRLRPRISTSTTARRTCSTRAASTRSAASRAAASASGARARCRRTRCGSTSASGGCSSSSSARSTKARSGWCSSRTTTGCGRASRTRSACSCARSGGNGALFGRTEEEAFFITCDRTTMTQDDILNGRLICEIGIAPVRPAEFVIFRIFQNTR